MSGPRMELTKAHIAFIKDIGPIHKDGQAQFGEHATLQGILSVVNPVLAKHGLSCHQIYDHTPEGRAVLKTLLRHTSGEELVSSALFPQTSGRNPLHDFGANTTYIRRFSLLAILGIAPGIQDHDGDGAVGPASSVPEVTIPTQRLENDSVEEPIDPAFKKAYLNDLVAWNKKHPDLLDGLKHAYKKVFPDFKGSFSTHVQLKKHIDFIDQYTHGLS